MALKKRPEPRLVGGACRTHDLGGRNDIAGLGDLGDQNGVRLGADRGVQIGHAPWRLERVDTQDDFARAKTAGAQRFHQNFTGLRLVVGRNGIFEIENERICR